MLEFVINMFPYSETSSIHEEKKFKLTLLITSN